MRALGLCVLLVASSSVACSSSNSEGTDGGGDAPHRDTGAGQGDGAHPEAATDTGAPRDGGEDAKDSGGGPDAHDGATGDEGTGLALTYLSVSKTADAEASALVPAFSPDVHDYYVRCESGANELTVSMTASAGAESVVTQPSMSKSAPKQTLTLSVSVNQAIVAEATSGTSSVEYWVRCLPPSFPQMEWTPHPSAGTPSPGYYLIGSQPVVGGVGYYAIMLDSNGVPVWYRANSENIYNVDNLVPGAVSWAYPTEINQLSPTSTTYVTAFGVTPDAHELQLAPGGDYYVIWSAEQTGVNLTGLTLPLYDGGTRSYGKNSSILACDILEVDPSGNVVWEWVGTDHFDPAEAMALKTPDLAQDVVEPYHCNSIDVDPATGNLLVSARDMNSVFYIEKSSMKVLWKLGGTRASKDHAVYVPMSEPFVSQHDARLQPSFTETCGGATGQISVFDDEYDQPGPARGVIYDVTVNGVVETGDEGGAPDCGAPAADAGATGAKVVWQYKGKSDSAVCGSMRVQPDGSRVIGWGQSEAPTAGLILTEVDEKGNDLLDMTCPDGTLSYRAIKIPVTAFPLSVLRANAGQ